MESLVAALLFHQKPGTAVDAPQRQELDRPGRLHAGHVLDAIEDLVE